MGEASAETKKKILDSAMAEFLDKGFMNASLRTIASNAGLTTGAMYRHFKDKDALFCALVDDAIAFARRVGAKRTLLIHVCHDVGLHEEVNRKLPADIQLAYDGQELIL